MWQIFVRFFSLGLVSFGGPAAHIGYFRKTFVEELGWLDDKDYASLVALSQFLPARDPARSLCHRLPPRRLARGNTGLYRFYLAFVSTDVSAGGQQLSIPLQ